jgi:glycosyltransferase involved in cell wall biosynthesis
VKILHVIDSEGMHGAETVVIALMKAQRDRGHEPVLGSIGERGSGVKEMERVAEAEHLGVQRFSMRRGPDVLGALRIRSHADGGAFDVVHTHGYKADILMGLIGRLRRRFGLIATVHGWTNVRRFSRLRFYEWLHRKMLRAMDAVVVVSEPLLADIRLKRIREKLHLIHNGIALDPSPSTPQNLADPIASFARGSFVVGTVGRLSPEKNHRFLLTAFKLFADKGVNAKLVIIGDGPERDELRRATAQAGLEQSVLLAGYRSNARTLLPLFDVFALPSKTEGTPVSVLEAMEAGIPVVATAVGGVPELLDHGAAGIIVDGEKPENFAQALRRLHESPQARQELARRGRERVAEKYSIQTCAQSYQHVYERIAASQKH